jgi:hypothetical protein
LRERPFPTFDLNGRNVSTTRWESVRARVLEPGDVRTRSLVKGGAGKRFNYWSITPTGVGTDSFSLPEVIQRTRPGAEPGRPGSVPIFSIDSIMRHGIRQYQLQTRYIPIYVAARNQERQDEATLDQDGALQVAALFLKKVHDWFVIAPLELSGTITTTRVMPEIRVGERLVEERTEGRITYYIEGVSHTWGGVTSAGSTTITVTRGEYEGEDLLSGVYERYNSPEIPEVGDECFTEFQDFAGDIARDPDAGAEDGGLSDQCRFRAPEPTPRGVVTGDDQSASALIDQGQTTADILPSEEDGEVLPATGADLDPGMVPSGDEVVDGIETPAEGPQRGNPVLTQEQLERGESINIPDVSGSDPLEGLDDVDLFETIPEG